MYGDECCSRPNAHFKFTDDSLIVNRLKNRVKRLDHFKYSQEAIEVIHTRRKAEGHPLQIDDELKFKGETGRI